MNNPVTPASALQYTEPSSAFSEIAEAAQQAPQAAAERDAKLSETKLAGQQAALSSLAQYANMPGIESGPLGQKLLAQHAKAAGIDLPMNPMGGIDIGKLRGMFAAPPQDYNQLKPADIAAAKALPPGERPNFQNAPADWQTAQAVTPLSEKAMELWMKPIATAEAQIGKGQGPQQARGLYSAVMNAYNGMTAHGQTGEAEALAQTYLNPAHTDLSDSWKDQKAGEFVDAQMEKLRAMNIHMGNEDKFREEQLSEKKREWNNLSAYQKGELTLGDKKVQLGAQALQAKINDSNARLQNALTNIGLRRQSLDIQRSAAAAHDYSLAGNEASAALRTAQGQYQQAVNTLNQMSQNPKMRNSVEFQNLTDQAAQLHTFLATNGDALRAQAQDATQGMASVMSNITGNPSQVISPPNLQPLKLQIQVQQGQQPAPPAAGAQAQGGATPVETRVINGVKWTKFSDGSFKQG